MTRLTIKRIVELRREITKKKGINPKKINLATNQKDIHKQLLEKFKDDKLIK